MSEDGKKSKWNSDRVAHGGASDNRCITYGFTQAWTATSYYFGTSDREPCGYGIGMRRDGLASEDWRECGACESEPKTKKGIRYTE